MKPAYCLNCEQIRHVEDWMPDRCICHECAHSRPSDGGRGQILKLPAWVMHGYRGWTQERQDAWDATCEAQMVEGGRKLGREMAERLNEKFWEAFLGAK